MRALPVRWILAAVASFGLFGSNAVFAGTTVYTDPGDFFAAVGPDGYTEDFAGFGFGNPGNPISLGPVSGFSYNIAAANGLFSGGGNMSTNSAFDPLLIQITGADVTAVGGNFWLTDFDFLTELGTLIVTVTTGMTAEEMLINPTPDSFLGFVSDSPITLISLAPVEGPVNAWATVDNLFVGTAAIPLPPAIYLFAAGLLGLLRFRRRDVTA